MCSSLGVVSTGCLPQAHHQLTPFKRCSSSVKSWDFHFGCSCFTLDVCASFHAVNVSLPTKDTVHWMSMCHCQSRILYVCEGCVKIHQDSYSPCFGYLIECGSFIYCNARTNSIHSAAKQSLLPLEIDAEASKQCSATCIQREKGTCSP